MNAEKNNAASGDSTPGSRRLQPGESSGAAATVIFNAHLRKVAYVAQKLMVGSGG